MVPPRPPGSRLGLLGGTFDPPHVGHLVVAETARVSLRLREVRFVVAGAPWMKLDQGPTPAEHRLAMVELAIAGNDRFAVDTTEIGRDGATYTVDTLETLAGDDPDAEIVFLVGADALARLDEWRDPDRCLELATFVALTRPGFRLAGPYADRVEQLTVPAIGVSSSGMRRRFATGEAVRYLVPGEVERYVRAEGLYGAAAEAP